MQMICRAVKDLQSRHRSCLPRLWSQRCLCKCCASHMRKCADADSLRFPIICGHTAIIVDFRVLDKSRCPKSHEVATCLRSYHTPMPSTPNSVMTEKTTSKQIVRRILRLDTFDLASSRSWKPGHSTSGNSEIHSCATRSRHEPARARQCTCHNHKLNTPSISPASMSVE